MISDQKKMRMNQRPRACPECGHAPVARIAYGYAPHPPVEALRAVDEGRLVYGGCTTTGDDPAWKCTHCGLSIYPAEPQGLDDDDDLDTLL